MSAERFRTVMIDGGDVHVVARELLHELDVSHLPESVEKLVRWAAEFALRHEAFSLGYSMVGPRKFESWFLLLETPSGPQRVHVEHLTCKHCGVRVDAANPTVPDLYFGVPNEREALDRAWAQPEVHCPRCGGGLPRRAIWAKCS